jgi:hypothetical protein
MSELKLSTGDVVTLNHHLLSAGLQPEHLELPERSFRKIYNCTKTQWFIDHFIPAYVFLRTTTRSKGKKRSLLSPSSGRLCQIAITDEEICPFTGSWAITEHPDRWVPVMEMENHIVPDATTPVKPIIDNSREWVCFHDGNKYCRLPMRWNSNLAFLNPDITTPQQADLVVAPGVKSTNYSIQGGTGKTMKPKLGAGVIVTHQQSKLRDSHDNAFSKHMNNFSAESTERWLAPFNQTNSRFIHWNAGVPKGAMAINWPITGIGKIYPELKPKSHGLVDLTNPEILLSK